LFQSVRLLQRRCSCGTLGALAFKVMPDLKYHIETEEEADGRWIAEITDLPGVMAYGATKEEAMAAAEALALRVIADRIEEQKTGAASVSFACGA